MKTFFKDYTNSIKKNEETLSVDLLLEITLRKKGENFSENLFFWRTHHTFGNILF